MAQTDAGAIENLRAILAGAGINPDGMDPSMLKATVLSTQKFLAAQYGNHSLSFALKQARARRAADARVSSWTGENASAGMIEAYRVVRPGQKQSKTQKWLNRAGAGTVLKSQAAMHENPSLILTAESDKIGEHHVALTAHREMQHGDAYIRAAGLSGNEIVNDLAQFDQCISDEEFSELVKKKNIVISGIGIQNRNTSMSKDNDVCVKPSSELLPALVRSSKHEGFFETVEFAEVPPDLDLLSEDTGAFLAHSIARHATRFFVVPYASFVRIAEAMPDPAPTILFVWSTGRCGSTLVSQLLHTHEKVAASLSEPNTVTVLRLLRQPNFKSFVDEYSIDVHVRCLLRMLFKDWKSKDQLVCVKPHPVAIEAQDLICKIMPQCRHCFLYRDAAPNIQSWHSLFNRGNVKEGERGMPPSYFELVPEHLQEPFATVQYLSPMLKPKAHLHVFYCAVMYHAIRLIKAGFLSNTFKYEDVIADPHKVLAALLKHAEIHHEETPEIRARTELAMSKDSQLMGKTFTPKPVYSFSEEEVEDFTPCHSRFGLMEFYVEGKLSGHGTILLPGNVLA